MDLTGQVTKEDHYFAYGGFSEIYRGYWTVPTTGTRYPVAVKIIRGVHTDPDLLAATTRRISRETRIWHQLSHDNILQFYGVCHDVGPSPALISPLCQHGNIEDYLRVSPNANRIPLICGIGNGLSYLHSRNIVHGDVKPHNVLIDDQGGSRLCDFGRSRIIDHRGYTTAFAGTARFMAPELLEAPPSSSDFTNPEDSPQPQLTKETDVYAFSMVALQILTSNIPFHNIAHDSVVIFMVVNGKRPEPRDYNQFQAPLNTFWTMLEACWAQRPENRPEMTVVLKFLSRNL